MSDQLQNAVNIFAILLFAANELRAWFAEDVYSFTRVLYILRLKNQKRWPVDMSVESTPLQLLHDPDAVDARCLLEGDLRVKVLKPGKVAIQRLTVRWGTESSSATTHVYLKKYRGVQEYPTHWTPFHILHGHQDVPIGLIHIRFEVYADGQLCQSKPIAIEDKRVLEKIKPEYRPR